MRVTIKGRYGIRTMIVLAFHYRGSPISAEYISKRERISKDYIEQLFIKLKKRGLIKSIRGPKGGFLLAKPPSRVKIRDILRCVEEPIALAPCVETEPNTSQCALSDNCIAQAFFKRMSQKLEKLMDSTSLADACKPRRPIRKISSNGTP